jgi:hypothetical protein
MGPGLSCKRDKEQHGNNSEEGANPQQNTAKVALTDAVQYRLVLPFCMCSAINQPSAPYYQCLERDV